MGRLTEYMVELRTRQCDMFYVKKLQCWGQDLDDVSIVRKMCNVEVLALSVNKIDTLEPFKGCKKLRELYLRDNQINSLEELQYVKNLPELECLWLEENLCCATAGPNYRSIVLRTLPKLKKLDNIDVSEGEVEKAIRLARIHESSSNLNFTNSSRLIEIRELQPSAVSSRRICTHEQVQPAASARFIEIHEQPAVSSRGADVTEEQYPSASSRRIDIRESSPLRKEYARGNDMAQRQCVRNKNKPSPKEVQNANLLSTAMTLIDDLDYLSLTVVEKRIHDRLGELFQK